jgi:hypothetical protein
VARRVTCEAGGGGGDDGGDALVELQARVDGRRAVAPVVVFAATGSVLDATGSVFAATGSVFGGSPPLPPSDTSSASASPMGTSVFVFAMPGI